MSSESVVQRQDIALILSDTAHFEGKMGFEGVARICGTFQGELYSPRGVLIVEEGAHIEAKIVVRRAVVKGKVKGEIEAKEKVTLMAGSAFYGALKTQRLHIEPGALFEGTSMKPNKPKFPSGVRRVLPSQ